jgi:hypothetical protein
MIPADANGFKEMYTRFYKLKREGRLFPQDREPDPKDYGLQTFMADYIKKQIEREMDR